MAKQLTNRSKTIQFLKTSLPGNLKGLYNSSIQLNPGQTIIVSDADFATMTIDPDFIQTFFVLDAVVDTAEEVNDLIALAGGGGGGGSSSGAAGAIQRSDGAGGFDGDTNLTFDSGVLDITGDLRVSANMLAMDNSSSIDTDNRFLSDGIIGPSLNWYERLAYDSSGLLTLDWENGRVLTGGIDAISWASRALIDGAGQEVLNWANTGTVVLSRTLQYPIGNATGYVLTSDVDGFASWQAAPIGPWEVDSTTIIQTNGSYDVQVQGLLSADGGIALGNSGTRQTLWLAGSGDFNHAFFNNSTQASGYDYSSIIGNSFGNNDGEVITYDSFLAFQNRTGTSVMSYFDTAGNFHLNGNVVVGSKYLDTTGAQNFVGTGTNDVSWATFPYSGGVPATFTATCIYNNVVRIYASGAGPGVPQPGDTVTDSTSGATGIVAFTNYGSGYFCVSVTSGTFSNGDSVADAAQGWSGTITSTSPDGDVFTLTNDAGFGIGSPVEPPTGGANIGFGYGIQVQFASGTGHTVGDYWTLTFGYLTNTYLTVGSSGFSVTTPGILLLETTGGYIEISGGSMQFQGSSVIAESDGQMSIDPNLWLLNSNGSPSVDWGNRLLWDGSHGIPVLDWFNMKLIVPDGSTSSVDWGQRQLVDSTSTMSLTWSGRQLTRSDGSTSLDWENFLLYDNIVSPSVDWNSRTLTDTSGISVDWVNRVMNDSSIVASFSWEGRVLYDVSGLDSVNYASRLMIDSAGSQESLDWDNRRLIDSANTDSVTWEARTLTDASGSTAADWTNGFRSASGITGARPGGLGPTDAGVQYFDTTINKQIWWNGTAWVELPDGSLHQTHTLTPADLASLSSYPGLTLVSGASLTANQGIVWESIEFLCDLTSGTPYTTTANFFFNISGNYSGGMKIPAGDTPENGNIGLLTSSGRKNRRFVFNQTVDMQIQSGSSYDLLLMADGPITTGDQNVQVRITYRIVDMLA